MDTGLIQEMHDRDGKFVFAITGVYMWYQLTRKRLLGWLILGGSCAYTGAMILYLIYAP